MKEAVYGETVLCQRQGCLRDGVSVIRGRSFCHLHSGIAGDPDYFLGCGSNRELSSCCLYCKAYAESGRRVLLIGERFVTDGTEREVPSAGADLPSLIERGAFRTGVFRRRLLRCGVRWDAALNLLGPEHRLPWEARAARKVAEGLREHAGWPDWPLRVLLGVRVRTALRVKAGLFQEEGPFLSLPHPSGRSRAWNPPGAEETVRRSFANFLATGNVSGH